MTGSSLLVEPAFLWVPSYSRTLGPEVADIATLAGFAPDADQAAVLDDIFAIGPDNKVVALEYALIACRQNLKTAVFKMCALGWLYVTDQQLITWSAHEFDTAQESHRELAGLIEDCPALSRRLKAVHYGAGDKSIELSTGQRVKFKARTNTGSRGLSGDKMVLDEAFALEPAHMGSLFPTLSARPDPQAVYGSSAGRASSAVLRALRDRGRAGGDPSLGYREYTDDLPGDCQEPQCDHAVVRKGCRLDDQRRWFRANTALGRRITVKYVEGERRAIPPDEFGRERLGWWDPDPNVGGVFPEGTWAALLDGRSEIVGRPTFAVEVAEDRSWACIGAAGTGPHGIHVESVDYHRHTDWVVARAVELRDRHRAKFVVQNNSQAGALIADLENARVPVIKASALDFGHACGDFFDAVVDGTVRHLGQPELDVSVRGAQTKKAGDGSFVFDRRSTVDITPLAAVTLAHWGASKKARPGRFVAF